MLLTNFVSMLYLCIFLSIAVRTLLGQSEEHGTTSKGHYILASLYFSFPSITIEDYQSLVHDQAIGLLKVWFIGQQA